MKQSIVVSTQNVSFSFNASSLLQHARVKQILNKSLQPIMAVQSTVILQDLPLYQCFQYSKSCTSLSFSTCPTQISISQNRVSLTPQNYSSISTHFFNSFKVACINYVYIAVVDLYGCIITKFSIVKKKCITCQLAIANYLIFTLQKQG